MNENKKYNVAYSLANDEGRIETVKGTVEFSHDPTTYGNGYYMYIETPAEPFGGQAYDIRYDKDFNKHKIVTYFTDFLESRYNGQNGAWRFIGLRIIEAERGDV